MSPHGSGVPGSAPVNADLRGLMTAELEKELTAHGVKRQAPITIWIAEQVDHRDRAAGHYR